MEQDGEDRATHEGVLISRVQGRWSSGQSGNPAGRPPVAQLAQVRSLARAHSVGSVRVLVQIRDDDRLPGLVRVAAADRLLTWAWGRPAATSSGEASKDLAVLSDAELDEVVMEIEAADLVERLYEGRDR